MYSVHRYILHRIQQNTVESCKPGCHYILVATSKLLLITLSFNRVKIAIYLIMKDLKTTKRVNHLSELPTEPTKFKV